NLPRSERLKSENVILVGMISGPKEASTDSMNHYLKPLVNELLEMYIGVEMTDSQNRKIVVCAALMCVACDISATRKTSGFTGHMSTCACHKCQQQFTTIKKTSKLDYSGFKYSNWANALNNTEQTCLEKENGTRWSELHWLSYFDLVRFTVIDPIHNLYLGTAK
ncbi:hypothetical protein PHYBLDRAFT_102018, partial [Phycomyces blakesleeanus NRRL 1555(-)]